MLHSDDMVDPVLALNCEQLDRIWRLAHLRDGTKFGAMLYGKHKSGVETHFAGLKSELAYSLLTGKPLDESIRPNGDYCDFEGVEIKGSSWPRADIELKVKCEEYRRKRPNHYVLARVIENVVQFLGCIRWFRFDYTKYPRRHTEVDNWCVKGEDLAPFLPIWTNGNFSLLGLRRK